MGFIFLFRPPTKQAVINRTTWQGTSTVKATKLALFVATGDAPPFSGNVLTLFHFASCTYKTTRERDCQGSNWQQVGDAATVPEFLNDHIWSFRNKCYDCPNPFSPCQYAEDDGSCSFGEVACMQKIGCGNRAEQLDCLGAWAGTHRLNQASFFFKN